MAREAEHIESFALLITTAAIERPWHPSLRSRPFEVPTGVVLEGRRPIIKTQFVYTSVRSMVGVCSLGSVRTAGPVLGLLCSHCQASDQTTLQVRPSQVALERNRRRRRREGWEGERERETERERERERERARERERERERERDVQTQHKLQKNHCTESTSLHKKAGFELTNYGIRVGGTFKTRTLLNQVRNG